MADNGLYWQRIGERQDARTAQAREASPVTVQVPKTGQQLVLERSFQQAGAPAHLEIAMISERLYSHADLAVWAAGLFFVLAFRFAVVRLHAWVEVLVVAVFLTTEVTLELISPALAAQFLKAGLTGIALLAAWTAARRGLAWLKAVR